MNYKKQIILVFFVGILLSILGIFSDPAVFGFNSTVYRILQSNPLISLSGLLFFSLAFPLIITSILLFFFREEIFTAWCKFAVFAFPIMVILLLYFFNNEPTYGLDLFGQDEELMSVILPVLFVGISLLIIGIKSWKLKKQNNNEK